MNIKTLAILLGEHPCIVNIFLGPLTVHYREVLLYMYLFQTRLIRRMYMDIPADLCVCACVPACVRACVHVCACVCVCMCMRCVHAPASVCRLCVPVWFQMWIRVYVCLCTSIL